MEEGRAGRCPAYGYAYVAGKRFVVSEGLPLFFQAHRFQVKRGLFDEGGNGFSTLFDEDRTRAFQKYVGLGLYGGFGDFYGLFICGLGHFDSP